MHAIKLELEDLGFRALLPAALHACIETRAQARARQPEAVRRQDRRQPARRARARPASRRDVEGREKHLYSIYQQDAPQAARRSREIVDVFGFRIVVDSRRHLLSRARRRARGCTSRCPGASRTTSRSRASTATSRCTRRCSARTACRSKCRSAPRTCTASPSRGIAAHWQYKAGEDRAARRSSDRAREWLQQLVEMQQGGNSEEFLESVKVDLFPDKVYVFTPKGEILRLPRGATVRRLRVRGAHRRRQPLRRREGRPAAGAAAHAAAQRPDGRDHHRQGRDAEPVVGEFRRHRQGARRDPALPQEPASAAKPSSSASGC